MSLAFVLFFTSPSYLSLSSVPVSCFTTDSIYEVSSPQVDRDNREVFEGHVLTGLGQVRSLCREDILMYREYIKNRYM